MVKKWKDRSRVGQSFIIALGLCLVFAIAIQLFPGTSGTSSSGANNRSAVIDLYDKAKSKGATINNDNVFLDKYETTAAITVYNISKSEKFVADLLSTLESTPYKTVTEIKAAVNSAPEKSIVTKVTYQGRSLSANFSYDADYKEYCIMIM